MAGGRRARWAAPVLAFVAAIVVGMLAIATNIATGLVPDSWTFADDPALMWSAVAGLLLLTGVLAFWAARSSSSEPADSSSVTVSGAVGGPIATAGSGTAVTGGSAPTFVSGGGAITYTQVLQAPAPLAAPGEGRIVVGDLPGAPPAMQHRAELDTLADAVRGGQAVSVVCAVGGRGVGKTQLAAAVGRKAMTEWEWPLVAWVSGEDLDSLVSGLALLAKRLGVADPEGDDEASARFAREALHDRREPGLLVVDNAVDADRLRPWLPSVGATRVVLTSNEQAMGLLGTLIEVGVFERVESVAYLEARTGRGDPDGAALLADDLGDLPVALAQAASAMVARRYSYAEMRRRIAEVDLDEVLVRRPGESYPRGAAESILLSVGALETDEPSVTRVLELVAVLSPGGVHRTLLAELLLDDGLEGLLERLTGASLLVWADTEGSATAMHRLVARVLRDRARAVGRLASVVSGAVAGLDRIIVVPEGAWDDKDRIDAAADHVQTLLDHSVDEFRRGAVDTAVMDRAVTFAARAVRYLDATANLSRAIGTGHDLCRVAVETLGADHLATLLSVNNVATAYENAGRVREAVELFEQAMSGYRRVLGEDHRSTLTLVNNLARAYRHAGRVGDAVELYERAVAGCGRLLGEDHPDTLMSMNNLARGYQGAGRVGEAVELFEQALAGRRRVLGEDHPDTFLSMNNLARGYQAAGRVGEAVELSEQALAGLRRVLGEDHPDTLNSANNLASAYQGAGRAGEAIVLLEQALAGRRRVLGEDHPDTLTSMNNLASAYWGAGRVGEAVGLLEQALAGCERALEKDHPTTVLVRGNLDTVRRQVSPPPPGS